MLLAVFLSTGPFPNRLLSTSSDACISTFRRCAAWGILSFPAIVMLCGCGSSGPQRAAVEGAVSLNGQPLAAGMVTFVPMGDPKKPSGPSVPARVKNGVFKLSAYEGPVVGQNRILIEATDYLGFPVDDEQAFAKNVMEKGPLPKQPVPEIYNTKSTLKEEVKAGGPNKYEFKLTGTTS